LNRFVVGGEDALAMNLPLYHLPNPKNHRISDLAKHIAFIKTRRDDYSGSFHRNWILSYIPHGNIDTSYLADIGKFLTPSATDGVELANDVALLSSFIAKETHLRRLEH